jgi:hypothetical protein
MNRVILALIAIFSLQSGIHAATASDTSCRNECLKCAATCDSTLNHCRMAGGSHTTAAHTRTIQDCVSLCRQSADFISRDSALSGKICTLCAEACNRCAQSCETFKGDKAMQSCARQCRTCAQACRKMTD